MKKLLLALTGVAAAITLPLTVHCNESNQHNHKHPTPNSHAPIGVMGDHMHKQGEWMVSYRFMQMTMTGSQQGANSITDSELVTTVPNRFAGMPSMPPTLRIAPQKMTTDMHMLGLMYAPSDSVTLMLMLNYLDKKMDLTTYQGGMGTNVLGNFSTQSSGIGDTKFAALVSLWDAGAHSLHAAVGLSIPTGDIKNTDTALTPMNMRPEMRLPYAMQLGTGTYDFEPAITYNGRDDKLSWGAQVKYTSSIEGKNDQGYQHGDKLDFSAWAAYRVAQSVSLSARYLFKDQDAIEGIDSNIMAPVQSANPDYYGGSQSDLALGLNWVNSQGHRLALEYQTTLEQDANGVQMQMDDMVTLGYQFAF